MHGYNHEVYNAYFFWGGVGGGGMDWMLDFEPNLECDVLGGQP